MYASSPVCKIVGEFSIKTIVQTDPSSLWVKTKKWAGVDKVFFDEYFRGYEVAYALQIGEVTIYEQPPSLSSKFGINRPPQSFCYVPADWRLARPRGIEPLFAT